MLQGGGDIGYASRLLTANGAWVNATGEIILAQKAFWQWKNLFAGSLTELEVPGHFDQTLVFNGQEGQAVDYNVIWLDEDSAIEYDCEFSDITRVSFFIFEKKFKKTILNEM